ncbi:hypothetical protein [Polaribacter sp. R77954]|uniref:hypothetical protein n=1 Tax=Polaribacter sp. R77954 TaxID=3093870 RepID=UPI0037C5CD2C
MKKTFILLSIGLLSSCSFLFPKHFERKPANFTIQNLWFTSKLDKNRDVKYLVNPTQLHYIAKSTDDYNEQLVAFFKEELKENSYLKENYKNVNGKIIVPFTLDYDLSKEYKENLQKTTDLDYIVLTKILTASQINNPYYPQYQSLQYKSNVLAGSVVFLKIFDVKNNTIALELNCKSSVYDNPNFNFDTNQYEDNLKIATYKSENQLIKKCFKRIFRRIK